MRLIIAPTRTEMGVWVAQQAAEQLSRIIATRGHARLLIATGSSQFEVLDQLAQRDDVDWSRIDGFHLDEYIGLSPLHPASFCKYLNERFVSRVALRSFHFLRGDQPPDETIQHASEAIRRHEGSQPAIDVALVGIGENGHLAFNDPPADFDTTEPYLMVQLDEACRRQQVGEGWFNSLEDVPTHAISMSVNQIMAAETIFCSVPDERKAEAVRNSLEGPVTPNVPASILQNHPQITLIVDRAASSLLSRASLNAAVLL